MSDPAPPPDAAPPPPEAPGEPGAAPSRERRPSKRRITVGLAVVIALLALAVGVVVGYVARGGPGPAAPVTLEREVPVVTVTTP